MGKKRKYTKLDEWYIWVFLIMIVFFIAITYYPDAIKLNTGIGNTLTRLFPQLLLSCIGIYMLLTTDKMGRFGGMMSLGIGISLLIDQLNTESLITADMLSGLTIIQLQTWIMVLSIILGAVFFSAK